MSNRGRKKKHYDKNVIANLIEEFKNTQQFRGNISYKEMFEFSSRKFEAGKLNDKLSEDFWRKEGRLGRELVDEFNKLSHNSLPEQEIVIISTEDALNQLFQASSEKGKIYYTKKLELNELGLKRTLEKNKKLTKKIDKLESENQKLREEKNRYSRMIEKYEQAIFTLADISNKDNNDLLNVITTGRTRTPAVNRLFADLFTENSNMTFINSTIKTPNVDNIVELNSHRTTNTLIDDFDL